MVLYNHTETWKRLGWLQNTFFGKIPWGEWVNENWQLSLTQLSKKPWRWHPTTHAFGGSTSQFISEHSVASIQALAKSSKRCKCIHSTQNISSVLMPVIFYLYSEFASTLTTGRTLQQWDLTWLASVVWLLCYGKTSSAYATNINRTRIVK